jgi:hypothetical protein
LRLRCSDRRPAQGLAVEFDQIEDARHRLIAVLRPRMSSPPPSFGTLIFSRPPHRGQQLVSVYASGWGSSSRVCFRFGVDLRDQA